MLKYFNPRSPHGERPFRRGATTSSTAVFQSTLPARGATPRRVAGNRIVSISIHAPRTGSDARTSAAIPDVPISIHAPRTGSDTTADRWFAFFPAFQSTLPARGATCSGCSRPIQPEISIHAPRTGSDTDGDAQAPPRKISIHAPRTGSDDLVEWANEYGHDFNPRSPHGERLAGGGQHAGGQHFNPRSPHGERQPLPPFYHKKQAISIHAPRTGSDLDTMGKAWGGDISIHAPRTGSDRFPAGRKQMALGFQSTLPARGATPPQAAHSRASAFQSTLPARGATNR